ncbi:cytochrome p450 9e2 [Lasius niger]|uniref:Cytochrome p450 9e2 n=1 Tax=Lasius niger TaxID=67767 RepID=A0A0J7JZT5_LASNI|nr:cytochrome p450 9e2 [Lasius niger]
MYNFNPDAKYVGFYVMTNPIILIRDLELVKAVFIKNFKTFPDRPSFVNSDEFLITQNLFCLHGEKWHNMRSLISSCFSSGQMNTMFALLSEYAVNFSESLSTLPVDKSDIDMKDLFTKYTNDIIARCVYGIKIDSIKDPTNKFYVYGKDAVGTSGTRVAKFIFFRTFPKLWRILNLKLVNNCVSSFFLNIIKVTLHMHEGEHVTRPNMIHMMTNIRDKENRRKLNMNDIAAQAFVFLFGGYETSSTTFSFAAHEIAANPEVQAKLRREIDEVLKVSDSGEVIYETINRLEYLDAVVNEVLRFYPPAFLEKTCDKTYELPPASPGKRPFVMEKGMICWIPVFVIYHNEQY